MAYYKDITVDGYLVLNDGDTVTNANITYDSTLAVNGDVTIDGKIYVEGDIWANSTSNHKIAGDAEYIVTLGSRYTYGMAIGADLGNFIGNSTFSVASSMYDMAENYYFSYSTSSIDNLSITIYDEEGKVAGTLTPLGNFVSTEKRNYKLLTQVNSDSTISLTVNVTANAARYTNITIESGHQMNFYSGDSVEGMIIEKSAYVFIADRNVTFAGTIEVNGSLYASGSLDASEATIVLNSSFFESLNSGNYGLGPINYYQNASYVLNVLSSLEKDSYHIGYYSLATPLASFLLKIDGLNFGGLTVNNSFTYNDTYYALRLINSNLYFCIEEQPEAYSDLQVKNGETFNLFVDSSITGITVIEAGGQLNLSVGSKADGRILIYAGGELSFEDDVINKNLGLTFNVIGSDASSNAMLRSYDNVSSINTMAFIVSSDQSFGKYKITDSAYLFNAYRRTLSLVSQDAVTGIQTGIGFVKAGETVIHNDKSYTLVYDYNSYTLSLVIDHQRYKYDDISVTSSSPFTIDEYTTVNGALVYEGGVLTILNGGTLEGYIILNGKIMASGSVNADNVSAFIELSQFAPDSENFFIEGFDSIKNINISIATNHNQNAGKYVIASGVSIFSSTIDLMIDGVENIAIAAGDSVVSQRGIKYSLVHDPLGLLVLDVDNSLLPPSPYAWADITAPTRENVTVYADFNAAENAFYSVNGGITWIEYSANGVLVTENSSVFFRAVDSHGYESPLTEYKVTNIDRIPPEAPYVYITPSTLTKYNVTVTAEPASDAVSTYYSFNALDWTLYSGGISVEENCIMFFKSYDAAGNESAITVKDVSNIIDYDLNGPRKIDTLKITPNKYTVNFSWAKPKMPYLNVKVAYYEVAVTGPYASVNDATGEIEYVVAEQTLQTKSASLKLKNLDVYDNYTVKVRAIDAEGRIGQWSDIRTYCIYDVTKPISSKLSVNNVEGSPYARTIAWTASDNAGVAFVTVKCGTINTTYKYDDPKKSAEYSVLLEDLTPGKNTVEITVKDAAGNFKTVKNTFTVADVTPPEKVAGLTTSVVTNKGGGLLLWERPYDNSGVVSKYTIEIVDLASGNVVKTLTSSKESVKSGKLVPGTDYAFRVSAQDKAKNQGEFSDLHKITIEDVIAPKVSALKAEVNGSNVKLTWNATDETGVDKVVVKLNQEIKAETTDSEHTLTALPVGTHYIQIVAYDAAGNAAEASTKVVIGEYNPVDTMIASLAFDSAASMLSDASEGIGNGNYEKDKNGSLA